MTDERWERFAREDAEYAERILTRCAPHLDGCELAIEIGCGVGRVALPVARRFRRVIGVDVSPTMLRKLVENAAGSEDVVKPMLADAPRDDNGRADLVYSVLVFQHAEDFAAIASYVRRIARALKQTGVACLQFDTRPRRVAYRFRNLLPDALVPGHWRRGLRRIRRSPASLRELFHDAGLEIVTELGAGSEEHVFVLRRA